MPRRSQILLLQNLCMIGGAKDFTLTSLVKRCEEMVET